MPPADETEVYHRMHAWYNRPECDALRAAWGAYPATPAALQAWPGFVAVTNAYLDSDAADDRPVVAAAAEPVAAEAEEPIAAEVEESEPVGASEVVPEVVEGEEGVVTEPVVASEAMEREAPAESGAEPGEATVGEGGGVLPGGPWAKSAVDPRITKEGGVMRLEAKLRARDGSLKDASVTFKPGEWFWNSDGRFKKNKKRKSPPPEELYTGPRDDGLLSTDEISGDYSGPCKPVPLQCNSMTVVPLGANTIEIGHSGCVFFPCGLCLGPMADGEVRTRKPGTNAFLNPQNPDPNCIL